MPLLSDESNPQRAEERESFRVATVSAKLNCAETDQLDSLAKKRGVQRGELIRQLILRELARDAGVTTVSPELTEIVGVRLLLINLLKATATGGAMTTEEYDRTVMTVKREKRGFAVKTLREQQEA
jgi:hypothetical protein